MVTRPISFILGPAYQGETRYAAVRNSPLRLPVKGIFSRSLGDCDDRKLRLNPAPATKFPRKYTKSLKHNRCSYLCELAPASRRRSFDLISMHGSEFYTHAPQRAHNPKGGQQDASVILNPPELHGVTPVDVLARVRLMSVASRYSGCRAVQIKVA